MKQSHLLTGVLLAVAGLAGWSLGAASADRPPQTTDGASPGAVARIEAALAVERVERRALAERVALLEARVERPVGAEPGNVASPEPRTAASPAPPAPEERTPADEDETLLAAGFAPTLVRAHRERLDQIELDRLYLQDRAWREGWVDSPRYARESAELLRARLSTRDEFGDELYDWTLFTGGQPNRVQVAEVMTGSPAADAGLERGDLLLSYGERRIFDPMELREQTLAGDAGGLTEVELLRDGQVLRVFVPRGPLGIRTTPATREPPPAG